MRNIWTESIQQASEYIVTLRISLRVVYTKPFHLYSNVMCVLLSHNETADSVMEMSFIMVSVYCICIERKYTELLDVVH